MTVLERIVSFGVAAAFLALPALPAWGADCPAGMKKSKSGECVKRTQERGLASLAPTSSRAVAGKSEQGTEMLNSVRTSDPRFLSKGKTGPVNVRLTGVCRGADGVVYNSGQKGYSQCIDSLSATSGSTSDYFSAYNQAGVGIQVNK